MTTTQDKTHYVNRVADQLMVAAANGYTVDEIATAAVERAKQVARERAAQELYLAQTSPLDVGAR